MSFLKKAAPYIGVALLGVGAGLALAGTTVGATVIGWFSSNPLSPKVN